MPVSGKRKSMPQMRLSHLFDAAVICHPHAQAIFDVESEKRYTFAELSSMVNQMARFIIERIATRSTSNEHEEAERNYILIAICMAPSTELIITLLAILKLEASYVPIEVTFPTSRIDYILNDCRPDALVINGMVNNLKEATTDQFHIIDVTKGWQKIELNSEENCEIEEYMEDPLFAVLYTSGSTGLPKGLKLTKAGVLNRLNWQWETFPYSNGEVCCFKTALTFVDSISEIYGPLLTGHQMIIIPSKTSVEDLVHVLNNHKVGRLVLVPSLLRSILFHCSRVNEMLPHLRLWVCSGEIFPADLLVEFFRIFNDNVKDICNFYGSTEVLGDVTYALFDKSSKQEHVQKCIPIGIPIQNTEIYLVDDEMVEVSDGTVGEMLITGKNLSQGYLGIEKTDKFITNPFSSDKDYNIMYRTGDYGRLDKGILYFEGRTDSQIKIRGHRIDITEVQNCLQSIEGVDRGQVLCYHPGQMDQMLVSFYTSTETSLCQDKVRLTLQKQLPQYMVPQVHKITEMPLLVNGKIDRQYLLNFFEQNNKNFQITSRIILDKCPNESKELAEILLQSCLKALGPSAPSSVSLEDNFSEIGGNSLNILLVLGQLQDIGYFIGIQEFISAKTFWDILSQISTSSKNQESFFGMGKVHEGKYKTRLIQDEDMDEVIKMVSETFCTKSELEVAIGCVPESIDIAIRKFPWHSSNELRKLSFILYDEENGEIVGVSINSDLSNDIEFTSDDWALHNVLEIIEYYENEVSHKLQANKVMHSLLLTTKDTISSTENTKLIYILEDHNIKLAMKFNYEAILTANTSPVTMQICQDLLDYTVLGTFQVNQWVADDGTVPFKNSPDTLQFSVDVKYL